MNRAKVIVHMHASIDGKIDGPYGHQPAGQASGAYYAQTLFDLSNTNANGATTVAMYAATGHPDLTKFDTTGITYTDWVPAGLTAETWDVSFDRTGRAGWTVNYFDYGGHRSRAIEVLTEQAPKAYLAFLRSLEIPYLVCGVHDLDLATALIKLKAQFGIESIALCGGAVINGAFLKAHLVDEISLVTTPYVSGDAAAKSVFDTAGEFVADRFAIKTVKQLADGGLHTQYVKVDD